MGHDTGMRRPHIFRQHEPTDRQAEGRAGHELGGSRETSGGLGGVLSHITGRNGHETHYVRGM